MEALRVIPYLQWWQIGAIVAVIIMLVLVIRLLIRIEDLLRKIYRMEKIKGLEAGYIIEESNLFKDWNFNDEDMASRKIKPLV